MNKVDRFLNIKTVTNKVLGKSETPMDVFEYKFTDKLLDTEGNLDVVQDAIVMGGTNLLIAPTGAGKTESVYMAAKQIVEREPDSKVVIAVPLVAIAQQMAHKNEDVLDYTGNKVLEGDSNIIFCSYEKVTKICEAFCQTEEILHPIYLIVDECHNLTFQQKFREKAISSIFSFMKQGCFASVLLMTATPDSLAILDIDRIISFVSDSYRPSMDAIEIFTVNDSIEFIKQMEDTGNFSIIRLNNKESIWNVMAYNPMFSCLTSMDKGTGIYRSLVEKGQLSGGGKIGLLATSVIQEGVSIRDYGDNLELIFIADANMTMDDVEQFFARARRDENHRLKGAKVLLKNPKGDAVYRDFKSILAYNYKIVAHTIGLLEGLGNDFKNFPVSNGDASFDINNLLAHMVQGAIEGLRELSECVLYDNGKVEMDENMLFLISYRQWQRQYSYMLEPLKKEVQERFGVPVQIRELHVEVAPKHKERRCIWDGIEDIREIVPLENYFFEELMRQSPVNPQSQGMINRLKANALFITSLKSLAKVGIKGKMAMKIIKNSNSTRKVNQYKEAYQIILMNQYLSMGSDNLDEIKVPHMKKSLYEIQLSIHQVIQKRGKTCFKINDNLIEECIKYYMKKYRVAKNPSHKQVKDIMKKMYLYKDARDDYMKAALRVNVQDIFKLVDSDMEQ